MSWQILSIGILFNALVSGTVAVTALALTLFLRHRWQRLDVGMRAYAWFWWFTALVWTPSSLRYLLASSGFAGATFHYLDILVQVAVFFTGPALYYYLSVRIFHSERLAKITSGISFLAALVAVSLILQPNGIVVRDVTTFSSEGTIHHTPFLIFGIEAGIITLLLLYDIFSHLRAWQQKKNRGSLYHALYSVSIVIYLILGSIDESKILTNWPLVIFRMLYAGSFLMAYIIITQDEAGQEEYLVTKDWGSPNAIS